MTPQDIISEARYTLNDTDSAEYRNSDAELLTYVNAGMREISLLRPEIFTIIGDMTCNPGEVEQLVTFADAQGIAQVVCIHGGAAVTPFDLQSMNTFNPNWRTDTPGAAQQWARYPGDPLRFFIYPPPPAAQVLDVYYVRNPVELALTDTIGEIPLTLREGLVWYVVHSAESKDDEHVLSQRAALSYQRFVSIVKPSQGAA